MDVNLDDFLMFIVCNFVLVDEIVSVNIRILGCILFFCDMYLWE